MVSDEEKLVADLIEANWDETKATKPAFYYDDTIKSHDFRASPAIKVYLVNMDEKPRGLGYTSRKYFVYLSVDMRAASRDDMMNMREHVKDILLSKRMLVSPFHSMILGNERKLTAYVNFYHYVREVSLKKYAEVIT